mgnify:FL=1
MSQILPGSTLGTFVAIEAIVATANKESTVGRMKGQKSRFLMLRMKNKKSARATQVWCTYFEGESITAEQLDGLLKHKASEDAQGGIILNMVSLKESGDIEKLDLASLFDVEGGVMKTYKFRKGMCYANDRNGNRINPIRLRDSLQVFCQADTIEVTDTEVVINYFGGCDPETVGSRLENQFYKEPFHQNVEPSGEEFNAFNGTVQPQVQTPQNPPQQTQQQPPVNPQPNPQQGGYQQGQQGQQGNNPLPY